MHSQYSTVNKYKKNTTVYCKLNLTCYHCILCVQALSARVSATFPTPSPAARHRCPRNNNPPSNPPPRTPPTPTCPSTPTPRCTPTPTNLPKPTRTARKQTPAGLTQPPQSEYIYINCTYIMTTLSIR